ncbi:MAG TPA: hypothetical protein VJX91_03285 [Candidatus Eisenbacteria bacterium]|nr:hypothetical protein [Candidatus Eisenbacteria bacterium]
MIFDVVIGVVALIVEATYVVVGTDTLFGGSLGFKVSSGEPLAQAGATPAENDGTGAQVASRRDSAMSASSVEDSLVPRVPERRPMAASPSFVVDPGVPLRDLRR